MKKFLSLVLALIVAMLPVCALSEAAATAAPEAAPAAVEAAPAEATAAPAAEAEAVPSAEATAAPAAEAVPAEATAAPEPTVAPDPNKVVASVDGDNILYSDVENYFNMIASQYSAYMDVNDASVRPLLMDQAVNYAIQIMLMEHKAAALGLDKLTDEDVAGLEKKAADDYASYMKSFTDSLKQSGVAEEEATKQAEGYLAAYGFTPDTIKEQYKKSEVLTRLQKSVTDPIQVTDEQVKAAYDEKVASQKTTYDETPASFCNAKMSGTAVYYTPAGVRTVKHILIKPEKIDEINQLKTKIADAATTEADKTDAQTKLDALLKEAQPKVDEVVGKIKAGEDFQGLIDTYGEDPGMKSGDTATTGYYVAEGAGYDKAFLDAAMALKAVGDVSDPVLGSYGYHIIRYEADVPSGTVDFETVKEALNTEALNTAKQDAFSKALDEWKAAAKIENFGL
jgi:parvulin-like peptidyl-prolyl isomerase